MRLSLPSVAPTDEGTAMFAVGTFSPSVPVLPPDLLPPELEPQPATASAAAADRQTTVVRVRLMKRLLLTARPSQWRRV
jgi:hypothetical protein